MEVFVESKNQVNSIHLKQYRIQQRALSPDSRLLQTNPRARKLLDQSRHARCKSTCDVRIKVLVAHAKITRACDETLRSHFNKIASGDNKALYLLKINI